MNILSLFDGMSCGRIALDRAGIKVDNYYASEVDKYAIKVSNANYPDIIQLGDINNWQKWDIDWSSIDLLIGGSPCFTAGTQVLTSEGYKGIESVKLGDKVLTHRNDWKKVLRTGGKCSPTIRIRAQGVLPTITTENHPYYVREMSKKWDNESRRYIKSLQPPRWKKAGELQKGDYLGIPKIITVPDPYDMSEDECRIIGRYIADGHTRKDFRKEVGREKDRHWQVILSVGSHKIPNFKSKHSCYVHSPSTHWVVFNNKRLVQIAEAECGIGAFNKKISPLLLTLPNPKLLQIVEGLLDGGGSVRGDEHRLTTVSLGLAQSLCLAVAKVYGTVASIEYTKRPSTTAIEGRVVNQKDTYTVSFRKEIKSQSHFIQGEDHIWTPFKGVIEGDSERVYNLEVEGDNSYTVNNVVVHNCQGFSFAGKQLAFNDPRSALFFKYVDILNRIKNTNPDVKFLLENVKMKKEYLDEISRLLGVEPVYINSALVSAQNRIRYYWCNFPVEQPEDKGITWGDIKEENASECHYYTKKGLDWINRHSTRTGKVLSIWEGGEKCQMLEASMYKNYSSQRFFAVKDVKGLRYISLLECERAQTVPDNYTKCVSNTQRYKMLGNGWTVDVIAHIFKRLLNTE